MSNGRPLPQPTEDTKPFWEGTRNHRLLIQKCHACGELQFYPRPYCKACLADEMGWVEATGKGEIYTYTINYRPANEYMKERTPYVVAIVQLEEGVRMMANIVESDLDSVRIGAPVEVVFEKVNDEITLPQFKIIC